MSERAGEFGFRSGERLPGVAAACSISCCSLCPMRRGILLQMTDGLIPINGAPFESSRYLGFSRKPSKHVWPIPRPMHVLHGRSSPAKYLDFVHHSHRNNQKPARRNKRATDEEMQAYHRSCEIAGKTGSLFWLSSLDGLSQLGRLYLQRIEHSRGLSRRGDFRSLTVISIVPMGSHWPIPRTFASIPHVLRNIGQ